MSVNEHSQETNKDVLALLKSQQELLAKQQQQLDYLSQVVGQTGATPMESHGGYRGRGRGGRRGGFRGTRTCFRCHSADHLIRDCPEKKADDDKAALN